MAAAVSATMRAMEPQPPAQDPARPRPATTAAVQDSRADPIHAAATDSDGASKGEDPRTLVAILTFGRADYLPALLAQAMHQAEDLHPAADVLVVDNDPAGTARAVVAGLGTDARYVLHGAKGIAEGRNRILDEAADYDCVVLIDDDEVPDPTWLRSLVDIYRQHRPTAVSGPQFRRYEVEPTPLVAAARPFDRPEYPTGTRMPAAATNNLLLDVASVREMGLRFDPRFSATGGSDTMFTRRLVECGGEIVWCQEAGATEFVPASRLSLGWVWKRSMRSGLTWTRTDVALAASSGRRTGVRVAGVARGVVRAAGGSLQAVLGLVLRRPALSGQGLRTQARGIGMISGSLGLRYREYRKTLAQVGTPATPQHHASQASGL